MRKSPLIIGAILCLLGGLVIPALAGTCVTCGGGQCKSCIAGGSGGGGASCVTTGPDNCPTGCSVSGVCVPDLPPDPCPPAPTPPEPEPAPPGGGPGGNGHLSQSLFCGDLIQIGVVGFAGPDVPVLPIVIDSEESVEDLREVIADLLGADADDDDGRLAGRFGIFAVSDAAKEMPAFTFSHGASSFGLRLHPSDQGDDRFQVSVPNGGGPAAQEILVPGQTLLVPIRLEGQPVLLAVALALLPDRSTTADLEAVQEEFWAQVGGVVAAPMALHVGQHEDEG